MPDTVTHNPTQGRYELAVEGGTAFANYRREGSVLVIPYVEAPVALRGQGVAGRLMEGVVAIARAEGWKIRPLCSYAAAWVRRHPEHHDLLAGK
jgi:predicted GNAT family acetyltransferase